VITAPSLHQAIEIEAGEREVRLLLAAYCKAAALGVNEAATRCKK